MVLKAIRTLSLASFLALVALVGGSPARANTLDPVVVTYDLSGSAGAWVLDFSVTNNIGGSNEIYFFGVQLSSGTIIGSPNFFPGGGSGFNPSTLVEGPGPNIFYNNVWEVDNQTLVNDGLDYRNFVIQPGQTLGGFQLLDSNLAAPTIISWMVFAEGGTYTGADYFHRPDNPGFAGTTDGRLNDLRSGNAITRRTPTLRHRPRWLRPAQLAQEAEGASGRVN
jgi:hypothetical protein